MSNIYKITSCRVCKSKEITPFFDLGSLPLPNEYLTLRELKLTEPNYPLVVCYCRTCSLVQLYKVVHADLMFKNYLYLSSASKPRLEDFEHISELSIKKFSLTNDALVIDIGSNDGSLLKFFKRRGLKTLGVDPAKNLRAIAAKNGIDTLTDYFSKKTARKILTKYGAASLITATNVFAHIDNIHEVMESIDLVLNEDGVFITQFPYLLDFIEGKQFDTIYHEHLSYFSLKPLLVLAKLTNFEIFDVERNTIDGGAIRVYWKRKGSKKWKINSKKIEKLLQQEKDKGLYSILTFKKFTKEINMLKKQFMKKIISLKKQGNKIIGYGAPAKGNILLNYYGVDSQLIDYVVDSTPTKQGLFLPGTHIPIYSEKKIIEDQPNFAVILAWNFADAIIKKNRAYLKRGGRFILPCPEVKIV